MANMNLLSKLKIGTGAALIHGDNNEFPGSPANGEMVMKDGVLYVYSTVDGVTTWFPLTNKKSIYVHQQAVGSLQWTVQHNFNTDEFVYMVYDSSHNLIQVNNALIDLDSFTVDFATAETGMVVVIANSALFVPSVAAQALSADSLNIASGVVVIDNTGIEISGTNINDSFVNKATPEMTGDLTTSGLIDGRDVASDGTKLDGVEALAEVNRTPAETMTDILTVDGAGTGLDADLLDGQEGAYYATASDSYTKAEVDAKDSAIVTGIDWKEAVNTFADLATTYSSAVEGWAASVNDVDIVYRYNGSSWVTLANGVVPLATGSLDGKLSSGDYTKIQGIETAATADQTDAEIKTAYENNADTNAYTDAEATKLAGIETGAEVNPTAGEHLTALLTVDGAGTGLDADLLDGQEGTYYLDYDNLSNKPTALRAWVSKTTAYTALVNDYVAVNTTGGAVTITLPATPALGDTVGILDAAGTASSNNITLARNSSNIMGLAEDMTIATNNSSFELVFIDATVGWRLF